MKAVITRLFSLSPSGVRLNKIETIPIDGSRYESVRVEQIADESGQTIETETHSVKLYSLIKSESPSIEIEITGVTGSLMHSSDFTKITCIELSNLTVSGKLPVPDREFAMPIRRSDGKLTLFGVSVVNGAFEAVLNFPTSGQYRYTDEEANIDLPEGTFTIAPVKIDVLRKVI